MASAQVVETSVTNNSPSQDSNHPDDLFQSRLINCMGVNLPLEKVMEHYLPLEYDRILVKKCTPWCY